MRGFATAELTRIRAAAEETMQDACVIGTRTASEIAGEPGGGSWDYDNPAFDWDTNEIACGYQASQSKETIVNGQAATMDGKVRLPIGTAVTARNRIVITKRQGQTLAESERVELAVIGTCRRCIHGLALYVQSVTDRGSLK